MTNKQLAHDALAYRFDEVINQYDTHRRIEVLIDEFLATINLDGKMILDAGCGAGHGTKRLVERGAKVIACDLGLNMVTVTRQKYPCQPTVGSVMTLPFADSMFDVVFSTEVIEHTPNPLESVREMLRVLKPEGYLVLSTPNWLWQIPVRVASALKIRPFHGLENFVKPRDLAATVENSNGIILEHRGIHLLPFQFSILHPVIRKMDAYGKFLLPFMINQCIMARKK